MTQTVVEAVHKATGDGLVTNHVASVAHDVIDRAAGQFSDAEARARAAAALSIRKLENAQFEAKKRLDNTTGRIAKLVRGRPVAAIGLVFLAGTVLGAIMRH